MSCPNISDFIAFKVQRSECLWIEKKMKTRYMKIRWELPCYFLRHQLDVVPQHVRFYCNQASVWWVSMCTEENVYKRDENGMRITELFLKTSARCCAPTSPVRLCSRFSVVSPYVWKRRSIKEIKVRWVSPCYSVRHQQDVVSQDLRFHCSEGLVWPVSMYREEDKYEGNENRMRITLLFLKASARYCAPTCPMSLQASSSVVSVYVHRRKFLWGRWK
jgi:hypothetical protein